MTRYEALAESRKKQRSADSTEERPSKRQTTLQEVHTIRSSSIISQSDLDDMILDHIVEDLQPFGLTERPTFKKIILRLASNRNVICQKTVMSRLERRSHKTMADISTSEDFLGCYNYRLLVCTP